MVGANKYRIVVKVSLICLAMLFAESTYSFAQRVLTLDSALNVAMENSPDIKQTSLDLERSKALLDAQNAALKSQFRLSINPFSYSRDRQFNTMFSEWNTTKTKSSLGSFTVSQPIKATDGTIELTNRFTWRDSYSDYTDQQVETFDNNLYLSLTQPIFTYNRTKLETRELELDLELTMLNFAMQKLSLERQVAQNFFSVYQSRMSYNISIEELDNQQQSYQIIKNKVDAGLAALEELYQAELNLANSKSTVQNREVSLQNALDNFKQLIGIPLDEMVTVDANVAYEYVAVSLDKALSEALKNRMELRQQAINLQNAQFSLIRTAALNEFLGNISLSYGLIGTDEQFGNLYDAPTKRQSIGISFEIPLWDWGEKKSRMKATEVTIEQRKLSIDDEKIAINMSIRQSYRSLNNLVNQIDIATQSVRNAELTYDINLERYKNGDLTSMDLNLYQTQLSERKISLVQAQIDYKLALLDLKIQTLWDFENNVPVLPEISPDNVKTK
ncbi:MAG: TolC family protein [Candidatus Latescibacteria bacterium]|nr:TolC family protein [Candidatus Latescibacterota bacterium]